MPDLTNLLRACVKVFRRDVDISPRASIALIEAHRSVALFGKSIAISSDYEVFAHVVATSPACADLLTKNGISLDGLTVLETGPSTSTLSIRERSYEQLLSGLFTVPYSNGLQYNTAGEMIRGSGLITEIDVFAGILEEGRNAILPNRTVEGILSGRGMVSSWGFVDERGEILLDQLVEECRRWANIDPSHSHQQLIIFLDDVGKIRLRPFGSSSFGALDEEGLVGTQFLYRGGIIQRCSPLSPYAPNVLSELEDLINSSRTTERDFQKFFERHPRLLSGLEFGTVHAHPLLYKDDGTPLIPDFFLEKLDAGWHAILDLKLASKPMVIRKRNRIYFAQWIQEAIAQLTYYKRWFDQRENRRILANKLGLPFEVFRPKIVLIAGRSHHFQHEIERLSLLANQERDLELWTYDDLLSRARRYREFLNSEFLSG